MRFENFSGDASWSGVGDDAEQERRESWQCEGTTVESSEREGRTLDSSTCSYQIRILSDHQIIPSPPSGHRRRSRFGAPNERDMPQE